MAQLHTWHLQNSLLEGALFFFKMYLPHLFVYSFTMSTYCILAVLGAGKEPGTSSACLTRGVMVTAWGLDLNPGSATLVLRPDEPPAGCEFR